MGDPPCGPPIAFCDYHRVEVWELSADDAVWAAELMERRRQEYARYSPVLWRPARDAVGLHTRFLARQVLADSSIALRTRCGLDHPGIFGGSDSWEDAGSWRHSGSTRRSCASAR